MREKVLGSRRARHDRGISPRAAVTSDARSRDGPPASRRILDATRALVARGGAAEVSMGDVARAAGVSKALVHYHFRDKESLLQALVDDVGARIVRRAEAFVASETTSNVLDRLWEWLDEELRRGDLRVVLALAEYDSARVRAAVRRIGDQRRDIAGAHVQHIFTTFALTPRVPTPLIADTVLAFIDGLAVGTTAFPDRDPRAAYDVLWLSLLTLAE